MNGCSRGSGACTGRQSIVNPWIKYPVAGFRAIARRLGARGPFEPTHYAWSRGLALLCDHNGGVSFVREQRGGRPPLTLVPSAFAGVRDGDLVWTRLSALPQFVDQILPTIRARIGLMTGDEDWSIPGDFKRAADICASGKVLCWFTQNFDGTNLGDKLFPLPIGLDFHTISNGRRWGHTQATPREQEQELEALRAAMPPNERRALRVHADFHFNKHDHVVMGETRAAIESTLRSNPSIDFQRDKLPRLNLWREKTRYAFVVSPHGNGLDCHRTWESLALGNIVIVKRSPLDPLYAALPVVIIDQWGEITPDNLRRWHQQHCHTFSDPECNRRLTNQYWIEQARSVVRQRLHTAAR